MPLLSQGTARAAAPFRNQLPLTWHRFRVGEFEATIISAGTLPLGKPEPALPASPPEQIRSLLTSNFLQPDAAVLEQNALVLSTGKQLILFDTGMGESMGAASKMFGPTTGRLLNNMRAAGIESAQTDLVVLNHAAGVRKAPARLTVREAGVLRSIICISGCAEAVDHSRPEPAPSRMAQPECGSPIRDGVQAPPRTKAENIRIRFLVPGRRRPSNCLPSSPILHIWHLLMRCCPHQDRIRSLPALAPAGCCSGIA